MQKRKIATLLIINMIVVALLLVSYNIKPSFASPSITEDDIYYYVSLFTVKMYTLVSGSWVLTATRDFEYRTHWYAKLIVNNTSEHHTSIWAGFTPKGKPYYIAPEGTTIYGYYVYVGLEESNSSLEGFDSLYIGIGANELSNNSSARIYFLDDILGNGAIRKEVYYNGTLIYTYPDEGGQPTWIKDGLPLFLYCTIYGNADELPAGGEPVPHYDIDKTVNQADEISKRLKVEMWSFWNNTFYYGFTYERLDYTIPAKWWVKKLYNCSYTTSTTSITKIVIGIEDWWWDQTNGQYDNFFDVVIDIEYLTFGSKLWYKIDMIQTTGSAHKVYWESDYLGSDCWVLIFDGVEKSNYTAWSPTHGPWEHDIWLDCVQKLDFNEASVSTFKVGSGAYYINVSGNELSAFLASDASYVQAWWWWNVTFTEDIEGLRAILGIHLHYLSAIPPNWIDMWAEIWTLGGTRITMTWKKPPSCVNLAGADGDLYVGFDDLFCDTYGVPYSLSTGNYAFKLIMRISIGAGGWMHIVFPPMVIESFNLKYDVPITVWQHLITISTNGLGTVNPSGSHIYNENSIVPITATPNSLKYFWFWRIRSEYLGIEYYCPFTTLNLPIDHDYNVTAYFSDKTFNYFGGGTCPLTIKGDVNLDGSVNGADLKIVSLMFGKHSASSDWNTSMAMALDELLFPDGEINEGDIGMVEYVFGWAVGSEYPYYLGDATGLVMITGCYSLADEPHIGVEVYYRVSGTTSWSLLDVTGTNGKAYLRLLAETYDFRAKYQGDTYITIFNLEISGDYWWWMATFDLL
jgi:hypothetical protein